MFAAPAAMVKACRCSLMRVSTRSSYNGNGQSIANGPDMRAGSPVPKHLLSPAVVDARAMTTTFWDLL